MRAVVVLSISIVTLAIGQASAARWYVDDSVLFSGDGKSWAHAFKKIQEGIDASSNGDTVSVAEGTYVENIKFKGKSITLTGTAPLNGKVVERTIIDGKYSGSVVTFSGTETGACVLSGFTIRNGKTAAEGGGICGGTPAQPTQATIEHNTITANAADGGGGLAHCAGTIHTNTITGNSARGAGGLLECGGTILNNVITGNSAAESGGGLYWCDGTVLGNTITDNSATSYGGGLYGCAATIQDNTIADNSAGEEGGGLARCNNTIRDNTITRNSAGKTGGGLYDCNGTIEDNAITENTAIDYGGGLDWCQGTIQRNTITGNSVTDALGKGGGLARCNGTIQRNTIRDNSADRGGGGLYGCSALIQLNTIAGNWADFDGGGLHNCDGMIQGNTITDNSAGYGGGLASCGGTIQNNTIAGNYADTEGGGLDVCGGTIQLNTIARNEAYFEGGGLYWCSGTILNCIIWGNIAGSGPQLLESSVPTYSCIQEWMGVGGGNIVTDPQFVDPRGPDHNLYTGRQRLSAVARIPLHRCGFQRYVAAPHGHRWHEQNHVRRKEPHRRYGGMGVSCQHAFTPTWRKRGPHLEQPNGQNLPGRALQQHAHLGGHGRKRPVSRRHRDHLD